MTVPVKASPAVVAAGIVRSKYLEAAKLTILNVHSQAFRTMITIPLALAEGTLNAIETGKGKLTRSQVLQIVGHV